MELKDIFTQTLKDLDGFLQGRIDKGDSPNQARGDDYKNFSQAWLADESRIKLLLSATENSLKASSLLMMTGGSLEDAMELMKTNQFNKPFMGLLWIGYKLGIASCKAESEIEFLKGIYGDPSER